MRQNAPQRIKLFPGGMSPDPPSAAHIYRPPLHFQTILLPTPPPLDETLNIVSIVQVRYEQVSVRAFKTCGVLKRTSELWYTHLEGLYKRWGQRYNNMYEYH